MDKLENCLKTWAFPADTTNCFISFPPIQETTVMARWRSLMLGWIGLVLVSGLAGCGSKTPAATSVKGRIWHRGEPLNGGMIVFVPDEDRGNSGPLVKGSLQPDGTFAIASEIRTGWYRIAVAPAA